MIPRTCCCCFDLEYGLFTWGVITLLIRICAATTLYISSLLLTSATSSVLILSGGCLFGWLLTTSAIQFLALKGIAQRKAMLIHPNITVLILEPLILLIVTVILCFHDKEWYILVFVIIGPVDLYCAIRLISLYKELLGSQESCRTSTGSVLYNEIESV